MATTAVTNSTSSTSTTTSTSTNSVSAQQDRFLKLLTTQLKNQDPLNPMDNAQMTSQLAQISTVDGLEKLNATLNKLVSSSSESQALQASALVGHSALVSGKALELGTSGALGGYNLDSAAEIVNVQIKNSSGVVVRTISLKDQTAGAHNFIWDGKDDSGTALATGTYNIAVSAKQGTTDVTSTALTLGTINAVVRNSDGTLGIDVGTLGRFTFDQLKQII